MLEKNGFIHKGSHGSHHFYENPNDHKKITVPHPKKDLPKGTFFAILKQAGIKD